MSDIRQVVADNLRRYAEHANISFVDLAEKAGVSRGTVMKLLAAKQGFDVKTLEALSDVLGVEPLDFFTTKAKVTTVKQIVEVSSVTPLAAAKQVFEFLKKIPEKVQHLLVQIESASDWNTVEDTLFAITEANKKNQRKPLKKSNGN